MSVSTPRVRSICDSCLRRADVRRVWDGDVAVMIATHATTPVLDECMYMPDDCTHSRALLRYVEAHPLGTVAACLCGANVIEGRDGSIRVLDPAQGGRQAVDDRGDVRRSMAHGGSYLGGLTAPAYSASEIAG